MATSIGNIIRNFITADDKTKAGFTAAGRNAKKYGTTASKAALSVKNSFTAANAVIAAATGVIARAVVQAAADAASYQQSLAALDSQVQKLGISGQTAMENLRETSAGLVDDKSLVEAANRALSLGIEYKNLGGFIDIARAKARDMGTTTSDAFNDLVTALGRSSAPILDNLGIIVKTAEANQVYADSIGKTVKQLTEQERKLAFQEAALKAGSEALARHNLETKTQAERMQAAAVQFKNIRLELGILATRVGVVVLGVFQRLSAELLVVFGWFEKIFLQGKMLFQKLASFAMDFLGALLRVGQTIAWMSDQMGVTENAAAGFAIEIDAAQAASAQLEAQAQQTGKAILGESAAYNAASELALQAADNFKLAQASAAELTGAAGSTKAAVDPRVEQERLTLEDLQALRVEAQFQWLQSEQELDANFELIHQDQLARKQKEIDLEKAAAASRRTAINSGLTDLATVARASNASFETQKKISIAQGLVGTYQATIDAFKSAGNPYLGAVLAALAFAANIAQVNAIRRTKPGSTSATAPTTGALPTTATTPAAPAAPINQPQQINQTTVIELRGDLDVDMFAAKLKPSFDKFAERGTFPQVQTQGAG